MLSNYKGQDDAVAQLRAEMIAAKATGRPLPNMLILGEPGTGKTTLAKHISDEMGLPISIMHCPTVTERSEVAKRITEAQGGILYCEEIHALKRDFAEDMYTVIDENTMTVEEPVMTYKQSYGIDTRRKGLDMIVLQDVAVPTGKTRLVRQSILPLTVIGATTDEALLPPAFLSRLSGLAVRLGEYSIESLADIAFNYALEEHKVQIEWEAAYYLASRSRLNPRRVKQFVDRAYAHFFTDKYNKITVENAQNALRTMGIDDQGLESPHRKMLGFLAESPLSRTSLAQRMAIPAKNVDLYFGELTRLGLAQIGSKHEITEQGRQAIA